MCVLCSVSILYVCVSVGVDVPVYVCALLNVSAVICMIVAMFVCGLSCIVL